MPQPTGNGERGLSLPCLRARVGQGALTRILEPIFAADFPPRASGYRPKRSAQDAVIRGAAARVQYKPRVLDMDLKASCDHSCHHLLVAKVARRVNAPDVMHVLRVILQTTGNTGVAQGAVLAPLLSTLSRTAVARRRERAKQVPRRGQYTSLESCRLADALVILVDASPQHDGLLQAVDRRLREALPLLHMASNEEKSRRVDLAQGDRCGLLGCDFRRRRRQGKWRAYYAPWLKKRTALLRQLQAIVRCPQSQPIDRVISLIPPIGRGWGRSFAIGEASRCFGCMKDGVEKKVRRHLMRARKRRGFGWKRGRRQWRYQRLGRFNDSRVQRPRRKALPAQSVPSPLAGSAQESAVRESRMPRLTRRELET